MADNDPTNPDLNTDRGSWRDAIRRPTFWVVMVALAIFVYFQWPTRVTPPDNPDYVTQELPSGVQIRWEGEPTQRSGDAGTAWHLKRKGIDFLVQSGMMNTSLPELARQMMAADQEQVNGEVYQPLSIEGNRARYALFDVENRIQRHRIYAVNGRWVKASVLYKAQDDERERRAQYFLNGIVVLNTP